MKRRVALLFFLALWQLCCSKNVDNLPVDTNVDNPGDDTESSSITKTARLKWAEFLEGSRFVYVSDLSFGPDDGIAVVGGFENRITFAKGTPEEVTLPTDDLHDEFDNANGRAFLTKYSADGIYEWSTFIFPHDQIIGNSSTYGAANYNAVDLRADAILAVGWIYYRVTFDPGGPNQTLKSPDTYRRSFFAKYSLSGELLSVNVDSRRNEFDAKVEDIAFAESGHAFLVGVHELSFFSDYDVPNVPFLQKWDPDGNLVWEAETIFGQSAVAAAPDGGAVVSGWFRGDEDITITGRTGGSKVLSENDNGIFLVKWSSDGNPLWVTSVTTPEGGLKAKAVTVLEDGAVVVMVYVSAPTVFGKGTEFEVTVNDRGTYAAKFTADGAFVWIAPSMGDDPVRKLGDTMLFACETDWEGTFSSKEFGTIEIPPRSVYVGGYSSNGEQNFSLVLPEVGRLQTAGDDHLQTAASLSNSFAFGGMFKDTLDLDDGEQQISFVTETGSRSGFWAVFEVQ